MPRSQYYGYDFNSRQPMIHAKLTVPVPQGADCAAFDRWLAHAFAIDKARLDAIGPPDDDTPAALARSAVNRAFIIYEEVLRAATVPVFDRGEVVAVSPASSDVPGKMVSFRLPVVDNLPASLFQNVFRDSLRLALAALTSVPDADATRKLLTDLDQTVLPRIKDAVPFTGTTNHVCRAIFDQGVPFRHLGDGVFRIGHGAHSQLLSGSAMQADSALGARTTQDKAATARLLTAAGFPGPENIVVASADEAAAAAATLGWPVVVKPVDRDRTEGVTTNIRTTAATRHAYDMARQHSEHILVERHVSGTVHRIMVAGGNVVYVVKRLPKGLAGDGRNTVSDLVQAAEMDRMRQPPWKRLKAFELDELADACLKDQGLTHQSVPAKGQWVSLRPLAAGQWGGEVEDLTAATHPDNIALAVDIAAMLGLTCAGIDLITEDIAKPWHAIGAIVNEVNFNPQFSSSGRKVDARRFVEAMAPRGGRIPVSIVTGSGDLASAAEALRKRLRAKGRKCHLTTAGATQDPSGRPIPIDMTSAFDRSLALLLRPDVQDLIVAVSPEELFAKGFAAERIDIAIVQESDDARATALATRLRQRFPIKTLRTGGT